MSNRNLIIILVVLIGVFLVTRLSDRRGQRNFMEILVELDTSKIDKVLLHNVEDDQSVTELIRQEGAWSARHADLEVVAQSSTIISLLNNLQLIKSKRLISRSEDKWADYEVNAEKGTRVEVFSGKKKLEDFYVGRFSFNQQTRTAISYIRKSNDTDTYSVDGFLSMSFNQSFNSFRNKSMVKLNSSDLDQVKWTHPDGIVDLRKTNNRWISAEGNELDSTSMAQYINALANTSGSDFDDNFAASNEDNPLMTLELFGDNMSESIRLSCYTSRDSTKPFILHSSMNKQSYFKSDSSGIYKKVFSDLSKL